MVLRTGAIRGPARGWDLLGAAAGMLLPVVLLAFLLRAGSQPGYSHVRDTISELGARGAYTGWFTTINIVAFALLLPFALAVYRRLPVGLSTAILLGFVAIGSLLIGVTPCSLLADDTNGHCGVDAHASVALPTLVLIAGFQFTAARNVPARAWRGLRTTSTVTAAASVILAVAVVASSMLDGSLTGLFERLFWAVGYVWVVVASVSLLGATRAPPALIRCTTDMLQQKIVRVRGWDHAAYIFHAVSNPDRAKVWIESALNSGVVRHEAEDRRPDLTVASVTLAFTYRGLLELGVPYELTNCDDPFADGMKARACKLGDVGASAPEHWDEPWRTGDVHILAWLHAENSKALDDASDKLNGLEGADGVRRLHVQKARQLRDANGLPIEHFGFGDGFGQPWVEGLDLDESQRPGRGKLDEWGVWRPIALGEFVLGRPDEAQETPELPGPENVYRDGSFLVVRKLAQNVKLWNEFIEREAARAGLAQGTLGAMIVGRHNDGRPVWLDGQDHTGDNNFTYDDDAEGFLCPLGAHIRRANPRHSAGFNGALNNRRRMLRRGMTYVDEDNGGGEWAKGLMFIAVNARILDQFEFVQRAWLNDGDRQGQGTDRDLIAGCGEGTTRMVLQGREGPRVITDVPQFVRTLGGDYFFVPSVPGLRSIAMQG